MSFVIKFYKKAIKEYSDAYNWYNEQSDGLGDKFEFSTQRLLKSIARNPLLYPNKEFDTRECKVHDFPYLVVYRIYPTKGIVYIISIFHTSRNPGKKYRK
jgi:hypothetical protein